jgi:ribose transport system ATP-binding protein
MAGRHIFKVREAMKAGIGLVPENRKEEGVFLDKPIRWNIAIAALEQLRRGLIIDRKGEAGMGRTYQERLRIKTPSLDQLVKNLTGGHQQKVVIAKTLAAKADIIIFDEPTRGIDGRAIKRSSSD